MSDATLTETDHVRPSLSGRVLGLVIEIVFYLALGRLIIAVIDPIMPQYLVGTLWSQALMAFLLMLSEMAFLRLTGRARTPGMYGRRPVIVRADTGATPDWRTLMTRTAIKFVCAGTIFGGVLLLPVLDGQGVHEKLTGLRTMQRKATL